MIHKGSVTIQTFHLHVYIFLRFGIFISLSALKPFNCSLTVLINQSIFVYS